MDKYWQHWQDVSDYFASSAIMLKFNSSKNKSKLKNKDLPNGISLCNYLNNAQKKQRKLQSAPVFHSPACKKSLYNHNYAKQTVLNKDTSN